MDKKNWMPESADDSAKRPAAGDADSGLQDGDTKRVSTSTFWNKKNLIVLIVAFVIVLVLLAAMRLMPGTPIAPRTETAEEMVIITVGDKEYARVPLSEPQKLTIRQDNGAVNVVEVMENGMRMVSSTCDNQICVHVGTVTLDNWELKPQQQFIHCVPNQVKLELTWPDE